MKPIQNYTPDTIERLKQWIAEMNESGDAKYYEIFVDGMRIVHKTNDVEEFDRYKVWLGPETQQIKVLTYNTIGSHRSKPFEFRTNKYPEEINYKEIAETLQKKNEEFIKRIADAETYIKTLEAESETRKSGFDMEKIISSLGLLAKQFPGLADNLGGLGEIINPTAPVNEKKEENCEATFRKKPNRDEPGEAEQHTKNTESTFAKAEEDDTVTFTTTSKLSEEQAGKMYQLMQFFSDNPPYIEVVFDLVMQEKDKLAA